MALRRTAEFRSGNHAPLMGEGRENIRWRHGEEAENDLREAKATASKLDARRLRKIQQTGKWLLVLPSTVNGTELGAQEWRDSLFLSYGIKTPDLQPHCDSCGAAVYICNTMYCKKGGLITDCHNKLCDGVSNLSGKAITPVHVRNNRRIFTGSAVRGGKPTAKQKGKARRHRRQKRGRRRGAF